MLVAGERTPDELLVVRVGVGGAFRPGVVGARGHGGAECTRGPGRPGRGQWLTRLVVATSVPCCIP